MLLEKLFTILDAPDIKEKKGEMVSLLNEMAIPPEYQGELAKKLMGLKFVFPNPQIVKSFTRSYLRIYSKGIHKDGRDSSIVIEITKRCNKNCEHCYSRILEEDTDMEDGTLDSIIKFARENYKHIFLTGGNPILDDRIFTLAENNPDIVFFMFNNGSGIEGERAEKLASAGNIVPMLSIDGSQREMHDHFRGDGAYKEVNDTIDTLNGMQIPWGYIALASDKNAADVLSKEFVKLMRDRGAVVGRYIEYMPVGKNIDRSLILSGENYYLLEKRKKEIIENMEIYMQETAQKKCMGLVFFDVDGNIKNCPFMHYSRFNVDGGDIAYKIDETINDWLSAEYDGECPIYSDPVKFRDFLVERGWNRLSTFPEEYLENEEISKLMSCNYHRFLQLKEEKGL